VRTFQANRLQGLIVNCRRCLSLACDVIRILTVLADPATASASGAPLIYGWVLEGLFGGYHGRNYSTRRWDAKC